MVMANPIKRFGLRATAALILLIVACPSQADFKRDYGDAMKAVRNEDWAKAAADLESAIADNPNSAARVRLYGMRFDAYVPHYFLGEARFRSGDCEGAIEAWNESLSRGVIQSQPQFNELQAAMTSCQGSVVDVGAVAEAARSALREYQSSAQSYEKLKSNALLAEEWTASSPWQTGLSRAQQRISDLSQRLQSAQDASDGNALQSIIDESQGANADLLGLLTQANARIDANRQAQQRAEADARNRARQDLLRALASARAADDKGSSDQRVRTVSQQLKTLVAQGDAAGANASAQQYESLARSIRGKQRELALAIQEWEGQQQAIARRTPPAPLKSAVEAYFSGDYERAANLADPDGFQEGRERIQAYLFRAAARFNMYELDGRDDRDMLQQVRGDIRAIKQINRNFSPYLAAFSPKFMSLFESTP
jgi:hypothetical protein